MPNVSVARKERISPSAWYADKYYRNAMRLKARLDVLDFHFELYSSLYIQNIKRGMFNASSDIPGNRVSVGLAIENVRQLCKDYDKFFDDRHRLVSNNVMNRANVWYLQVVDLFRIFPDHISHCNELLGFYLPKKSRMQTADKIFWEYVAQMSRKSAVNNHIFRLVNEAYLRKQQGWYPVFNTLTVDSRSIDLVFKKGSRIWRNHIRSIERAVRIAAYGSSRANPEKQVISYFSVVERGSVAGRLHIHYLMWLKALPLKSYDPNQWLVKQGIGEDCPRSREINRLKQYWRFGFSSPIAVRTGYDDPYAKLGWKWPVSRDEAGNYTAIPLTDIRQICQYVVKYLTKDYSSDYGGMKLWRTRQNRTHGLIQLQTILSKLKIPILLRLMALKKTPLMMFSRWIPIRLLRWQALKIVLSRMRPLYRLMYPMMLHSSPRLSPPSRTTMSERLHRRQQNSTVFLTGMTSTEMADFSLLGGYINDIEVQCLFTQGSQLVSGISGISRVYHSV